MISSAWQWGQNVGFWGIVIQRPLYHVVFAVVVTGSAGSPRCVCRVEREGCLRRMMPERWGMWGADDVGGGPGSGFRLVCRGVL